MSFPGNNDETCEPDYQMHALGQGYWTCNDNRLTIDNALDSTTWIHIDPNTINWTDSSQVEFTLFWNVNSTSSTGTQCSASSPVIITFFQTPEAFAGTDIGICGTKWRLNAIPSIAASGGHWTVDSMPAGAQITFGDGSQSVQDSSTATIYVSDYGIYYFVWHEYNLNNEFCNSTDTVTIEFIREPQINAGSDDNVCGWRYQMQAQMDQSGASTFGTWQNAPVYWTDSTFWYDTPNNDLGIGEQQNQDPNQQASPTAYITHPVTNAECNDSVIMVWQEYSMGTLFPDHQCVSKDSVTIHFFADIKADNNTVSIDPEVCGLQIDLTNSQNIYCAYGYWIDSLSIVTDWNPANDAHNTTATVGQYTTDAFAYVIQNGPNKDNPVCQDTSDFITVTFKQKPQVDACPDCDRVQDTTLVFFGSNTLHVDSVRTDTVCFSSLANAYALDPYNNIGTGYWKKTSSSLIYASSLIPADNISYYENDSVYTTTYNSSNNSSIGNFYILVWTATNSENGCDASDTLLLSIAKTPSAEIGYRRPYCHGESAKVWAEPDVDANPTQFEWAFEDSPSIDSTESGNSTHIDSLMQGPHYVRWTTDGDCDHLTHGVSLITESGWGCRSLITTKFIKEPEIVYPQTNNIDATCGQNNGMIMIIKDSIQTCNGVVPHTISTSWVSSTLQADPDISVLGNGMEIPLGHVPSFQEQINFGENKIIDSIYGLSPNDTSILAVDYVSLITLDSEYIGEQVHCKDTLVLTVNNSGNIDAIIDSDRMNTSGAAPLDVTMYHSTPEASRYTWIIRDEDGNIIAEMSDEYPMYTFSEGNYEIDLIVKSREGCYDTTTYRFIKVDSETFIKIPNVFTPNGDGANDYFQVYAKSLKAFKGFIMNRWGKLLYEWEDWTTEEKGWDGKIGNNYASPGVYYYVIRYKGIYDEDETEVKGALELVREKK